MDRWVAKTAIVTGASSGIGEAIAEELVKAGMQVVGLARRVELVQANSEKLTQNNYKGKLYAVKCDIRSEAEICKAFEWTTKNVGIVHVLVNNAGIILPTNLINGDAEMWRTILETNIFGLCVAQKEACKLMMAHNIAGHIVNINSDAGHGHYYFPTNSVYGASKHALTNICEMMRLELLAHKSNIKITSVSPSETRTGLTAPEFISEEVFEMLKDMPIMESKNVADAILYSLSTPPDVLITEISLRAIGNKFC
ncbi:farnesol dehydrogenase-like [Atheta coriaria]|uniref:farnesol dehydrogenase-like n=1 Tax=Dalotia coriaria TaxID=877792 RepID=UPI0031F44D1D